MDEQSSSGSSPTPGQEPSAPKPTVGDSRPAPRIGDTRPAPANPKPEAETKAERGGGRGNGGRGRGGNQQGGAKAEQAGGDSAEPKAEGAGKRRRRRRSGGGAGRGSGQPSTGRYLLAVHVNGDTTHIATLEGRSLVEHYVAKAADETNQIDGNIYVGRVQNVLPGMEAAFVDIGIPKNAVLYRGDVRYDSEELEGQTSKAPRIEEMLKNGQTIVCQVTKNPIGAKGARLTQEVSLPGRFAVLVPNSDTFGISKRLGDNERKRLKKIVDGVKPANHGLIVRTAAQGVSEEDLARDITALVEQWEGIAKEVTRSNQPRLAYREPNHALRMLREELSREFRSLVIDDRALYEQVRDYVADVSPELVDRVEFYDTKAEELPLFERYLVHEQLHKALDRKVWLPSGGSLIIERTEALTVIDVNTGKNVGKTSLEETVYRNNLEAAEEVARQLRLRDIGGIIVIDFIDMDSAENRTNVATALRQALARDKTRTQVFDISELGLVEMTRKRISEGLIESLSHVCGNCDGRGIVVEAEIS